MRAWLNHTIGDHLGHDGGAESSGPLHGAETGRLVVVIENIELPRDLLPVLQALDRRTNDDEVPVLRKIDPTVAISILLGEPQLCRIDIEQK